MRKWLTVMFLLLAVLLALPAWTQTFAIRAGNLFDPAKGTVTTHQIILVKDKKIVEVGPSVAIPKDSEVIDLSNEWVMPGIMDAHTHVTWGAQHFKDLDYSYVTEGTGSACPARSSHGSDPAECGDHDRAGRGQRCELCCRRSSEGDRCRMVHGTYSFNSRQNHCAVWRSKRNSAPGSRSALAF